MFKKLVDITRMRFFRIELAIFGIVGLLALLFHFSYGTGLLIVGALLLLMRFSSTPRNNMAMGTGSYTMERQILKDIQNPGLNQRAFAMMNDMLIIALLPLIIGVIVSLIFR